MTFTPNIPTATQSLGQTQQPIQDNFNVINTTLSVNHVAMNSSGAGKHKYVQMPQQGSAPGANANEGVFYTKSAPTGTELFYRRASNAATQPNVEVQMTGQFNGALNNGYVFLPGKFIMQWGFVSITATGSGTVTLPVTIAGLWNVQCTPVFNSLPNGGTTVQFKITSSTTFQYYFNTNSGSYTGFNWVAIGSLP